MILHPTDFSERSESAFHLACALARDYGARLILLHVAMRPVLVYGEGVVPPDPEEDREVREAKLHRLAPGPPIHTEYRFEEGDPASVILQVAQEAGVDLIVMGTHGRRGLARLLMGSVAGQVVRQAPCPVLTVRVPFPQPVPVEAELLAEPVPG